VELLDTRLGYAVGMLDVLPQSTWKNFTLLKPRNTLYNPTEYPDSAVYFVEDGTLVIF